MENSMEIELNEVILNLKEKLEQAANLVNQKKETSEIMNEIWALSKTKFILETALNDKLKKYKGIIFTVGFSAEPIILNIIANHSECVFFIYTKESEYILNSIIVETQLKPTQYKRHLMPRDSAAEAYRSVKKGIKFLTEEKGLKKDQIALDPTGGTKIMSVGCGIAASVFNLDVLYVNNLKYNPELRRPEPGSEMLVNIQNPFDIFQDDKLLEGFNYLKNQDFSAAKGVFYSIKQTSRTPLFPNLLATLADVLYSWDMIDYKNALKQIKNLFQLIEDLGEKLSTIRASLIEQLTLWKEYLEVIYNQIFEGGTEVQKISPLLIYDILKNANREFNLGKFNNAALKYYRTIEMINQFILLKEYNLDTQNPRYNEINENTKEYLLKSTEKDLETSIKECYSDVWKFLNEKMYSNNDIREIQTLPNRIGLIAGIIIRYNFGDSSINKDFILKVLQAIDKRNQSIFAHGIASITKKGCNNLKIIAEKMVKKLDIEDRLKPMVFNTKSLKSLEQLFIKIV